MFLCDAYLLCVVHVFSLFLSIQMIVVFKMVEAFMRETFESHFFPAFNHSH